MRVKRSRETDPTRIRLSDNFLLSDFMGGHSIYSRGLKNVWEDPDGSKLKEGRHLCETILEPLLDEHGPISISHGYISPEVSRRIVSYQDPNKPSYHRWDKGAAADICVHSWVVREAPIFLAHDIDQRFDYSRMITYSESPFICVATQINEGDRPRKAFYENRYTGKSRAKPAYIKKSNSPAAKAKEAANLVLEHGWKGEGYPTYHGGGIRQFQHCHTSKYTVASDFLYSQHALREGIANAPDLLKYGKAFKAAGKVYDALLIALDIPRLSIVRGFESFRFNDYPLFSWKDHFAIDFIPPSYIKPGEVEEAAEATGMVSASSVCSTTRVVRLVGAKNGR